MEKLQKVLDAYSKYLESLKSEETDEIAIKTYYGAMKKVIEENAEPWLKQHMLQDCFVNALRAKRNKEEIKAGTRLQLLIDNLEENLARVKISLPTIEGEVRFSWLPTLYNYFRPKNMQEVEEMERELTQMLSIGLVSLTDFQLVEEHCIKQVRTLETQKEIMRAVSKKEKTENDEELEAALSDDGEVPLPF